MSQFSVQTPVEVMSKPDTLRKLLALGPLRWIDIEHVSGWRPDEVKDAVSELIAQGAVTYEHGGSGERLYKLDSTGGESRAKRAAGGQVSGLGREPPHRGRCFSAGTR